MNTKNKQVSVLMTILTLTILLATSGKVNAQDNTWAAPADAEEIVNPFKNNTDAVKKGKILYNKLCSICHGTKGKGDGMAAMALKPKPANFASNKIQVQTDGAIFWKLTEGKAPMASYKESLKEEERWQLVSYIRELGK